MLRLTIRILVTTFLWVASTGSAQLLRGEASQSANPFERHLRVAEKIYVYEQSNFVAYSGPSLSTWNPNATDGVLERKRLGTIVVAASVRLNLEVVTQPQGVVYELRDLSTGSLIQEIPSFGTPAASLLFSGQGVLYSYARITPLCWGSATRKYEFSGGRFVETRQALLIVDADTELLRNVKLTSTPNVGSSVVAVLPEGSKAQVLAYEPTNRFLIRTPLGLTGWLHGESALGSLTITRCN